MGRANAIFGGSGYGPQRREQRACEAIDMVRLFERITSQGPAAPFGKIRFTEGRARGGGGGVRVIIRYGTSVEPAFPCSSTDKRSMKGDRNAFVRSVSAPQA